MEQGRSFSGRERNCGFLNVEGERFATVSAVSGLDFPDDGRAIAVVDWDQDGDLDLWVSNRNAPRLRFLRNNTSDSEHHLAFQLVGNGTTTNRDAIGARVEVIAKPANEPRLIRTLRAGEGFLSQSSKVVHFGLGTPNEVEKVVVHWPGGESEEFSGAAAGGRFLLKQGSGVAREIQLEDRKLALSPSQQSALKPASSVRIPLISLLPMPPQVVYADLAGSNRILKFDGTGQSTLIVIWASWCAPCRSELAELKAREHEIRRAGIEVVALTVDGLGDDGTEPDAAELVCEELEFPFATGKASPDLLQLMTGYHHMLVAIKKQLPVPSSFLIDREGKLTAIYKGRLDVDQVIDDAQAGMSEVSERSKRAASLPGRTIDHDPLLAPIRRTEANLMCGMANAIASGGKYAEAIPWFLRALENEPQFGEAYQGLAQVLEATQQYSQSAKAYQQAITSYPDREMLHLRLGNVHARLGKWQDALASYNEAIRLNPRHWEALAGRANARLKLNHRDAAAADFKKVLELNPRFTPARRALDALNSRPSHK